MKEDVQTMLDCYLACTKTINHCLEMGGEHASPDHINLLMDCAKICMLASDFAARGSNNHQKLCKLCADICRQCAQECENMADGNQAMLDCAEACRKCAETCDKMAQ